MNTKCNELSRRELLEIAVGLGGCTLCATASTTVAHAQERTFTQPMVQGPYYPQRKPRDQDADLTTIRGGSGRALGQIVHVTGRVVNENGEPVSGARIEVWQANARGRYTHPSDPNPAPVDPNFTGYGVVRAGRDGHYSFTTIKPGAYPGLIQGRLRAPHIHFDVGGKVNRLITQMFFPDQPENETDALLQAVPAGQRDTLIARISGPTKNLEPDSIVAVWDIVLMTG
jgi:protocatechuate 3,4-dioxygenase beta subunit